MQIKTILDPGSYLMLSGKTTYGKRIINNLGAYWQINTVTEIEDIQSIMLDRCVIEEKIRGGPETLVIDKSNKLTIQVTNDMNFNYEPVIYEEDND